MRHYRQREQEKSCGQRELDSLKDMKGLWITEEKEGEIIRNEDRELYRDSSYPFNISLPEFYALKGQNMARLIQDKALKRFLLTEQGVHSIISLLSVIRNSSLINVKVA